MLATKRIPATNLLLASLPRKVFQSYLTFYEPVELVSSKNLGETCKHVCHVYFPTSSFISLVVPIDSKPNMEVGLVGSEGMVGLNFALGVSFSLLSVLVQAAANLCRNRSCDAPETSAQAFIEHCAA